MHISRKRDKILWTTAFNIDSSLLPNCDIVRDLGVEVDSGLNFSMHINHIVSKALTRSYLLSRSFTSRDTATLVKAFKVYVRPIVEYCSVVWSPHHAKDINLLESVQRRFTKHLPGLRNTSYPERLKRTGLERLDVRRLRYDLMMTYKILFGIIRVDSTQFFTLSHNTSNRGHDYKLYTNAVATDARKFFFCNRVVPVWNDMPDSVDYSSLGKYKKSICDIDLTKYCKNLKYDCH
jgi:hypothetical protein